MPAAGAHPCLWEYEQLSNGGRVFFCLFSCHVHEVNSHVVAGGPYGGGGEMVFGGADGSRGVF
jgi:hypothetical protein